MTAAWWGCTVGPMDRSKLPHGADGPLRQAVAERFAEMFGDGPEVLSTGWGAADPTVDAPTRPDLDLAYHAWTVIANAYGGDWSKASDEWRAAAERWRDAFHASLDEWGEHAGSGGEQ